MVDLGKVKITKKVYRFNIVQKFQQVQHYKKRERPPIEIIKNSIKKMISPKKDKTKKEETITQTQPQSGFNFMILGAAIVIALIILGLGWMYISSQFREEATVFKPLIAKPEINNIIMHSEVLTAGARGTPNYIGGLFIDYKAENVANYTVSITSYEKKLPSEVFILNSKRDDATTYSDFVQVLRNNLAKRKIPLNELTIQQLETLPEGAIVIIPSGAIPKEIIGIDSSINMDTLANRGVVVIYIGQPFTRVFNNSIIVTTPSTILKTLPIIFDETSQLQSDPGFSIYQPLYRVLGRGGWKSELAYGSVSVLTKGDGAFIFLPQTLDSGWRGNYTGAADDVTKIIREIPWAKPIGQTMNYQFSDQNNYSGQEYFFSEPFEQDSVTLKVDFTGYVPDSNVYTGETLFTHVENNFNSKLFIAQGTKVVSTNVTNELIRMNAQLNEPVAMQPNMFIVVSDINGTDVETFPQGAVSVQADRSFDIPIYIEKGEYIVKLVDDESTVYAQTYMKVVSIDVIYKGFLTEQPSVYVFEFEMDDNPVQLGDIEVIVDDGKYGTYKFSDTKNAQIDVGRYTNNENLPSGPHDFRFSSGGLVVNIPVSGYESSGGIFDNPLFLLVIVLTIGVVAIGIVFARQERVNYSVDIPDFPPIARTKIPLSPDVVLSIFPKVNENYRWENTPLTPSEVKNGFKAIFSKGRPIYITDYNVDYLLDELQKKGAIHESIGYFGLATWEEKTGKTMDYLALMRKLRDICVNNAVPFTGMDESKEADSVITVVGQQMYVNFFEKNGDHEKMLKRVLPSINNGITIILFKSDAQKERFTSTINCSPTPASLIAKMELDSNSMLFLTPDELEQMLKEFKGM
ncbi:hypothetical protein KKF81_01915 [Candidatus Micrarchaeota archaeon]|nr:hypothetical protein [Candidatus Micrarchaeota archaeon]MBU1165676.1 hypothetical protein [Candidatus Micrarchaeota archaeon]MBU1887361.1 hypothetical protein [Candidatus Micrarchaeota archaeon]